MPRISSGRLALASAGFLFTSVSVRHAGAEVTLTKADGWEVSTSGRVNAFFSYGWGDGNPIAHTGENIPVGAGLDTGFYAEPGGMNPDGTLKQGKFSSMRMRSGFVPNVLSLKVKRQI